MDDRRWLRDHGYPRARNALDSRMRTVEIRQCHYSHDEKEVAQKEQGRFQMGMVDHHNEHVAGA